MPKRITFDSVVKEYESDLQLRGASVNTIQTYMRTLRQFAAFLGKSPSLEAVTPEKARRFMRSLQEQDEIYQNHPYHAPRQQRLSKFTVHKHFRALRSFGNWMEENGYDNPFADLPKLKRPKRDLIEILQEDEIKALFDLYNPNTGYGARWQAILAFFLGTGCRLSEAVGLTLDNLDLDHNRAQVRGKGDKERWVVFGAHTHQALARYINRFRPETKDPHVFVGLDGLPLTVNGMENIIRNARKKSGIARLHCHLLRHTFATRFLLQDGKEFDLQMLLGHEDLSMTRQYVHLAKQLRGPTSLEGRRPDPLDGIGLGDAPQGYRRGRRQPAPRASRSHSTPSPGPSE